RRGDGAHGGRAQATDDPGAANEYRLSGQGARNRSFPRRRASYRLRRRACGCPCPGTGRRAFARPGADCSGARPACVPRRDRGGRGALRLDGRVEELMPLHLSLNGVTHSIEILRRKPHLVLSVNGRPYEIPAWSADPVGDMVIQGRAVAVTRALVDE